MNENIAAPLIFSEAELKDRYRLHRFIYKLFTPCKKEQSQLLNFDAQDLYELYSMQFPRNVLTSAIVSNVLLMGGFVEEEYPGLCKFYASINEQYFMNTTKEMQMFILKYMNGPIAIRYRQLLLGVKVNVITAEGITKMEISSVQSINNFLRYWTINNNSRYKGYLKPQQRSTIQEVYDFYRTICRIYGAQIVEKQLFIEQLDIAGYTTSKGRVHEKAGHRYFCHLFIPTTMEDMLLSVKVNMCCIYNGTSHWTPKGLLEDYTEADVSTLCIKNLEGMGYNESERKKIETKKCTIDLRRALEEGQIPISKTKKMSQTQNDMGHNSGTEPKSQEAEAETIQSEHDGILRTSGFITKQKDSPADTNPSDRVNYDGSADSTDQVRGRSSLESPSFGKDPVITDDYSEPEFDPLAERLNKNLRVEDTNDEAESGGFPEVGGSLSEDSGEAEPVANIEEIAEALKIPYQMTPKGAFTKDVMVTWLERMHIEVEDSVGYYELIMPILEKIGGGETGGK